MLVTEESTVREGIIASGVLERYPELNLEQLKVGIFGKLTPLNTPLRAKDRVEIYRPLIADPKAVRKERAAAGKRMKKVAAIWSRPTDARSGAARSGYRSVTAAVCLRLPAEIQSQPQAFPGGLH
ncbi:MAG: RnfH family protein [Thiolinea sp.]